MTYGFCTKLHLINRKGIRDKFHTNDSPCIHDQGIERIKKVKRDAVSDEGNNPESIYSEPLDFHFK